MAGHGAPGFNPPEDQKEALAAALGDINRRTKANDAMERELQVKLEQVRALRDVLVREREAVLQKCAEAGVAVDPAADGELGGEASLIGHHIAPAPSTKVSWSEGSAEGGGDFESQTGVDSVIGGHVGVTAPHASAFGMLGGQPFGSNDGAGASPWGMHGGALMMSDPMLNQQSELACPREPGCVAAL